MRTIAAVMAASSMLALSGCSTVESMIGAKPANPTYSLDNTTESMLNIPELNAVCADSAKKSKNYTDAVVDCAKAMNGTTFTLHGTVMQAMNAPNMPVFLSVGRPEVPDTLDTVCPTAMTECRNLKGGDKVYVVAKMMTGQFPEIKEFPADMPVLVVQSVTQQ